MEIEEIRTWQWVLAGLIAGTLFSCVWSWNGPSFDTQSRDTMLQGEFENGLMALTKFGTVTGLEARWIELYHKDQPLLRYITVHPPIASDPTRFWVTGEMYSIGPKPADPSKINGPEKVTYTWKPFKYPASIPYEPGYTVRSEKKLDKPSAARRNAELAALKKAIGGQSSFPTVVEYLKAVATLPDADLSFKYAWWEKPAAVWSLPPFAGLLMIGIAWPMTLSAMQNFGLAKLPPVKVAAKPNPVLPKRPVRPAMPTGVILQPTAPVAPVLPTDQKEYGGEFYPVVKATHKE